MNLAHRAGLAVVVGLLAVSATASAQQPAGSASARPRASASAPLPTTSASAGASASASASAGPGGSASAPPAMATASASAEAARPPASAEPAGSAAAPASSAAPPLAPGPAPSATAPADAPVRINQTTAFVLRVPRAGQSPEQRALAASAALKRALDEGGAAEVRVEAQGDGAVVFLGARPVVELGPEDAAAAGEASPQVHAARIAGQLRDAVRREQSRSATLMTILSLALVILSALMALFLVRRAGILADRTRAWIAEHPDRVPAIRLRSIEVIRPASLRAAIHIGVGAAKALAQIGIAYGWVLITLSLFEPTRAYAERLTGFVFGPLYALLVRLVSSVPVLVVAVIAGIALVVLVRFIGLFFDSVGRGETTVEWLPADLAAPTSVLVRSAVILSFFVVAAPLVTGDDGGTLARVGIVAVVALGLAVTPLLACVAVGVTVVYGRRLRAGDFAEVGGRAGRVRGITLLEVRLEDDRGSEVRVPHLLGLLHPTRVLGPLPLVTVTLTLASHTAAQDDVLDLLEEAARNVGERPQAELLSFDADGARYAVSAYSAAPKARSRLYATLAEALAAADVPLGRDRREPARAS